MELNTCGCRSCGGPQARADALLARRIVRHKRFILARRGTTGKMLAKRVQRPDLYTRLLMTAAHR
jgi:hypothetical protein